MPQPPRPPRVMVLAAALFAVGLAGCSSGSSGSSSPSRSPSSAAASATVSPTPSATVATAAPRPTVGSCHRSTYATAVAPTDDSRPVPCGHAHTTATYHVGTIDAVVDGHLLAVDSRQVQQQLATDCPARLPAYVGGTAADLRISMLRAIWFSPTIEASDAGADWYRCDVVLLAGSDRLATLDGTVAGALGRAGWQDRYGRCGTQDPADVGFEPVVCSRPHSWQAIGSADFRSRTAAAAYPGAGALISAGTRACEAPARARATDPLKVTWSYQPPTSGQWREGQHYGLCWVPSTS